VKIAFTILGEVASMKNSRTIVKIGNRPALIKSAKAREYEKSALLQIPHEARQMLTGPVRVTMRIFYASQRPDLDGALLLDIMAAKYKRAKGKLQALGNGQYQYGEGERVLVSKGCYVNDRQCREIHQYHGIDKSNPRAEIEIEAMQPQQAALIDEDLLADPEDETDEVPF
jgi:Holliday junction resolvase RusA-like endonuclease